MNTSTKLLLKITKTFQRQQEHDGTTYVVVKRSYGHLLKEMERVFEKERNVRVILDTRNGDRRKKRSMVGQERRARGERRGKREEMVEIIVSQ